MRKRSGEVYNLEWKELEKSPFRLKMKNTSNCSKCLKIKKKDLILNLTPENVTQHSRIE